MKLPANLFIEINDICHKCTFATDVARKRPFCLLLFSTLYIMNQREPNDKKSIEFRRQRLVLWFSHILSQLSFLSAEPSSSRL